MADKNKRGLGRGLSALMADVDLTGEQPTAASSDRAMLPIEQIAPNPDQPRRTFEPEALKELASSLKSRGILQPLIVRRHPKDESIYQIVAGERRWRAAQIAQLHEVPVIVRELTDTEVLEVAIIENIQRSDLNAIEEAASYRQLMDRFGHTQEKMADALNKSRSHIANQLRLLSLPGDVQDLVKSNRLTAGHARALVTAPNASALARKIAEKGLSVREVEALVKKQTSPEAAKPAPRKSEKDADTRALESDLSASVGMKVQIDHNTNGAGQIKIAYKDLEELDQLCSLLAGSR